MGKTESIPETLLVKSHISLPRPLQLGILAGLSLVLGLTAAFLISQEVWIITTFLIVSIPFGLLILTYPFAGLILWLVLMPFLSLFPNTTLATWVIYRLLTPTLLGLVVVYRTLKVRNWPPVSLGLPELALGALILLIPVSILFSQNHPGQTIVVYGDRFLLPISMYLIVRFLAPRERELQLLQWTALFIVISQALIGFLSWFVPQLLPSVWRQLQGARTTGSLMDADLYATMLLFGAALLIQGAPNRNSKFVRLVFYLASGVSLVFVFLSLERAAWLAGFLVVSGLILLFRKVMFRLILIGVILIAVFGSGVLSLHISLSMSRFMDTGPVYDRLVITDAMLRMFQEKPILGWGYETLDQNIGRFYRRVGEGVITRMVITSHNSYLTLLVELGLVGFCLYIFPVMWWFLLSLRVWRRLPKEGLWSRSLLAVLWLSMLCNFTVSNFIDMRWLPIGLTHWWLTLGLIANMVYPYLKGRIQQTGKNLLEPEIAWAETSVS